MAQGLGISGLGCGSLFEVWLRTDVRLRFGALGFIRL